MACCVLYARGVPGWLDLRLQKILFCFSYFRTHLSDPMKLIDYIFGAVGWYSNHHNKYFADFEVLRCAFLAICWKVWPFFGVVFLVRIVWGTECCCSLLLRMRQENEGALLDRRRGGIRSDRDQRKTHIQKLKSMLSRLLWRQSALEGISLLLSMTREIACIKFWRCTGD